MPTLTDSTSLSLQQVDFIISRSDVPLGYANRSLQGERMQWEGLEHPHGPVGSCSRVGGSWAVGVLCVFTFLSCGWLLTLRATRLFLMGMSKGTGSGVSSKLQLCSSCCFSPFRLLSGKGDAGGGRVGISPLPPTGGVVRDGCWWYQCFHQLSCKSQDLAGILSLTPPLPSLQTLGPTWAV